MADAEEKAKAEKLAAAKKRVEEMKKKKAKKAGGKKEEKSDTVAGAGALKSEETPETSAEVSLEASIEAPLDTTVESTPAPQETNAEEDKKYELPAEVPENIAEEEKVAELSSSTRHGRSPSLSVQSKMRSSSFRQASGPLSPEMAFSPSGDTAPDIYRKQALKIEDLERENKRLSKEAGDAEKRWKKVEEDLEDLREADGESTKGEKSKSTDTESAEEVEKLKSEIAALQRQNSQLQVSSSRKHGSPPSASVPAASDLEAELRSKSSTIESMEIEISNLRAQLERIASGSSVEKEQITALEDKLARSEKSAAIAQRELGDLKKNLERTTEKAVKEGSERISAETKLRTLEREAEEAKTHSDELQKKVEALEKKVSTLTTLHKEHDARSQTQKRERERVDKEALDLRTRLASVENENLHLKEERDKLKRRAAQGADDDGVDELENEERERLERKIRDLEAEVHDLRRGLWRDRRREMEGEGDDGVTSPGARFTDVDLGGGSGSPHARKSGGLHQGRGIGDYLTSGFNAITGGTVSTGHVHREGGAEDDELLDDDELLEFDEEAFGKAQQEEAMKRIERVKEIKRGLKDWEGWRLDLVENRRAGGEGVGEIFEI
ncbi:hypothetical protein SBOR_8510 [Sclerotinia borealis F-4128]|uniref:M protein repeat protein n=1 Tax=Sclerotinia borealis (strain F-4128) TaxID=1432307 RepID=W9C952_SCLBF|nr:hypothetical protein SBOR_8510 [Sclerotinia borealis F-4128]